MPELLSKVRHLIHWHPIKTFLVNAITYKSYLVLSVLTSLDSFHLQRRLNDFNNLHNLENV